MFDLDGVLIDSRRAITGCLNDALADTGRPRQPPRDLERFIGPPLAAAFAELTGAGQDSTLVKECVAAYRRHYAVASLRDTDPVPGIDVVLGDIAAQWPLALATSKSIGFVRPLLAKAGIEDLFGVICGPAMSTLHESKGETIRRALTGLGHPTAAVMVGDRSFDIAGAKENGISAIGVVWGVGDIAELGAAGADVLVEHPSELAQAIKTLFDG